MYKDGQIIEKNGKMYVVRKRVVPSSAENAVVTERAVPYYHIVNVYTTICGASNTPANYEFFSVKPADKPIDGNFTTEGIRHDMKIYGIRGFIKPFIMGAADADTVSLIASLYASAWTLKLGEGTEVLTGLMADILPKPKVSVLVGATPTYLVQYEERTENEGYMLLRKEPGTIDQLSVREKTSVNVEFKPDSFPATVVQTVYLGISLLTVPVREFPNG